MPAAPKRADVPITAADAALAEHVLREKFEEFRSRWKQQSYDVCIDTATALKRWDALAAVHGNMGNRYARGNDAESLVLATEQYKLAAEFCTMWSGPDAKLKEAHWKCCLAWTFKRSGHSDKGFEAAHEALREARGEHEEDERPDMRGEAEALKTLGALHENLGDFDEAQECYESALDLAVRCGDRRQEFNCLHYLGVQASYNYSDWQKARSIWERALGVAVDLQCENAEAHACAELAIVIRNLIPRRPQKESPEEAEAAELTKTAVAYYVRAKELKEAYVNGTGVGSGPSSPTKSGGGDPGSPSSATSQMLALTAPKAVAPTSPSRNNARVWKFELVHDDKDSLLDYGVDPREHHERCPPPVQEYSINLSGNETMLAEEGLLMSIEELASEHPENICLSSLDSEYFASLPDDLKPALLRCMNSGVTNPDSKMGCYACHPEDYDRFSPFFSKALAKYHGVEMPATHISSWELDSVPGLPEGGVLDLEPLGLMEGRNLASFPLPGAMDREQRCEMENKVLEAFGVLIGMEEYGGRYVSLTPDHPNFINNAEYDELVSRHIMFKDMSNDKYLQAAGIASDWPHGRGCYISQDEGFLIWVGEEDHLRIMAMRKGKTLNKVFDRLRVALEVVEGLDGLAFARTKEWGYVTSCPTNLGTGMRASVLVALPKLAASGGVKGLEAIAKPLGLAVRGLGGEHTDIGEDGTVDVSPSARFCVSEAQIMGNLYNGLQAIMEAERSSEGSQADSEMVEAPGVEATTGGETGNQAEPAAEG